MPNQARLSPETGLLLDPNNSKAGHLVRAVTVVALALSCSAQGAEPPAVQRWYSMELLDQGRPLYLDNCAGCHGVAGRGDGPLARAGLKPPVLDGGGHSAHHSLEEMLQTVANGRAGRGGLMPAFGEILSESERRSVVAFVQSLWSDAVYRQWAAMNRQPHGHGHSTAAR